MTTESIGSNGRSDLIPTTARELLALVRIVNGGLALFKPKTLMRLLGAPEDSVGVEYALRLFGVRTIVIGLDLVSRDPIVRDNALKPAVVIHASDVAAAAMAGFAGQLPRRAAFRAALISSVNVALAFVASRGR